MIPAKRNLRLRALFIHCITLLHPQEILYTQQLQCTRHGLAFVLLCVPPQPPM